MIATTNVEIRGKIFKKTVSDTYKIRKIGTDEIYCEAVDLPDTNYEYEETEEKLPEENIK